jgi:membrane protein implicated in regulation of membrane protease activity
MIWWTTWWAWMAGAFVLAIMELLSPTFILLGFAIGAFVTGGLLYLGGAFFATSLPYTLLFFALVSLVAWVTMRKVFGVRRQAVRTWNKDQDIND